MQLDDIPSNQKQGISSDQIYVANEIGAIIRHLNILINLLDTLPRKKAAV
jgi:hypothetical protein